MDEHAPGVLPAPAPDEAKSLIDQERIKGKELKPQINEFLYDWVPEDMTIRAFEKLTTEIFRLVAKSWDDLEESHRT